MWSFWKYFSWSLCFFFESYSNTIPYVQYTYISCILQLHFHSNSIYHFHQMIFQLSFSRWFLGVNPILSLDCFCKTHWAKWWKNSSFPEPVISYNLRHVCYVGKVYYSRRGSAGNKPILLNFYLPLPRSYNNKTVSYIWCTLLHSY